MNQSLDDTAVYMQTMSSSKFAKAFADDLGECHTAARMTHLCIAVCNPNMPIVGKWTQTVSLIAETLEVWMQVQKKWQYLEAIFVGAEDIAMQLPDEAKRFEGIIVSYFANLTKAV